MFFKSMGKNIALLILLIILSFSIHINSYASYIGGSDNISGGGKITWEEALETINTRIEYFSDTSRKYHISVAVRESEYLVYVCTTFDKPYSTYEDLALQFYNGYNKMGLNFEVLDESEYNLELNIMEKMMSNNNTENSDKTLIADSGFNVLLNAFPFSNLMIQSGPSGVCAGISALTMTSYLNPGELSLMNFDNTKNRGSFDYKLIETLSTDVNFNKTSIFNPYKSILEGKLINYKPDSDFLKAKIPYPGNTSAKNKASQQSRYLDMLSIEKKDDYELIKGLFWLLLWSNDNYLNQQEKFGSSLVSDVPCPVEELDLVIEELKNGRPVEVSVHGTASAHSVIGYRLWQDKLDPNIFYMDIYDSNIPKNSDWYRSDYQPTLVIYKGTVPNRSGLGLYFYYAPLTYSDGVTTKETYRFTDTLHFSDWKGHILHKDNSVKNWGKDVAKVEILSK